MDSDLYKNKRDTLAASAVSADPVAASAASAAPAAPVAVSAGLATASAASAASANAPKLLRRGRRKGTADTSHSHSHSHIVGDDAPVTERGQKIPTTRLLKSISSLVFLAMIAPSWLGAMDQYSLAGKMVAIEVCPRYDAPPPKVPGKPRIIEKITFLLDATGSMGPIMNKLAGSIETVIRNLINDRNQTLTELYGEGNYTFTVMVSVIMFRDYGEDAQYIFTDFTYDVVYISGVIEGAVHKGGGDEPEDVYGAFLLATFGFGAIDDLGFGTELKLSWDTPIVSDPSDPSETIVKKTICLVTDAYPHGKEFTPPVIGDRHNHPVEEWYPVLKFLRENNIHL